jgi:hypothetical protein
MVSLCGEALRATACRSTAACSLALPTPAPIDTLVMEAS